MGVEIPARESALTSHEDWEDELGLPDLSDLSDSEIGLFPSDKEELDHLLAHAAETEHLVQPKSDEGVIESPALLDTIAHGGVPGARLGSR
jgi:hypothetical protein